MRIQPARTQLSRIGRARMRSASTEAADDDGRELEYPLAGALRWWRRRGYTVTYTEPRLVQVTRADAAPERTSLLLLAGLLMATACILVNLALRQRLWHTVTLTIGPDGRVFTHRLRTRRPPLSE